MKTKIFLSAVILFITGGFLFLKEENTVNFSSASPAPPPDNQFIICSMDNAIDESYTYIPNAGFNTWHKYTGAYTYTYLYHQWPQLRPDDNFNTEPSVYEQRITSNIGNNRTQHGLRTLMDRPKFQYLLLGQSSDYQCEHDPAGNDYDFYSYNISLQTPPYITDISDNSLHGSGQLVKHCVPDNQQTDGGASWICTGIKANREQANKYWNEWQSDHTWDWYVMPSIRIPNGLPDNTPVCSLVVNDWDGNEIKNVIIKAENFKNQTTPYSGIYLNEFYWNPQSSEPPSPITIPAGEICPGDPRPLWDWNNPNFQTDFKVYWYGECEMWIDYVKVENLPAYQLFKGLRDPWITAETDFALTGYDANNPIPNNLYIEEFEFNTLPCMKYVNNLVNTHSLGKITLMANLNYDLFEIHKPDWWSTDFTPGQLKTYLVDYAGIKTVVSVSYCLEGWHEDDVLSDRFGDNSQQGTPNPNRSFHPSTLYPNSYDKNNGILSYVETPVNYENWLQDRLDFGGGAGGGFMKVMKLNDALSKIATDITLVNLHQSHLWWSEGHKLKEPSNEELSLLANLAVSYGARGIMYFWYGSFNEFTDPNRFGVGLRDNNCQPRYNNVYGQLKWNNILEINDNLNKWGSTLMSFNNTDRHSYIYRLQDERSLLYQNSYFSDLFTYKIGIIPPSNCDDDFPQNDYPPSGCVGECKDNRYLQATTFENADEENTNYFMIVNRRCSPFINDDNETNNGGRRFIRVKFVSSHSEFDIYNTWKITEIGNEDWALEFNKMAGSVLDLGWFQPGEGKLYKMIPVMKSGGNLLADEYVPSGETFTCEDTVWTNGYNLTIENGVTIHFSDSAKFVVEGGTFQLGTPDYQGPLSTEMDGSWKGFEFVEANVKIYNTNFSGLANDSISMLTMIDCPLVDLRNNAFSLGTGNNKGAIDIAYSGSYAPGVTDNVYIGTNTFPNSSTALPYVKIMAYSGITTPVIIESNTLTGLSTALFLSNIQGGAIKSNTFTGFDRSVTALSSSLDIYDNTISSTTGIYGLEALSGTELKMSYAGGLLVGGRNNITNSDSSSSNIYLEDSYFLMDEGENIFDVGYDGWHLYGWFPESYSGAYYETENCFKVNSTVVDPPVEYVTLGEQGYQITDFVFTPYLTGCTQGGEGDMMVINLGNDIYDTVELMGEGGSYSSNYIVTPKSIYDSISISMRFRNYANVKSLCLYLLNAYPDSVQSLGALSKLYLAVSKTDTTTQGITNLKTLYENLILNHSNNISLVKRSNYYVQKCKVLLHQYSSALAGFQQIINNNPASYEGLVARWDYMATSLLLQGQGGSEKDDPLFHLPLAKGETEWGSEYGDDDKSPFTREERKQIRQTVTIALEISKYTEKKREKVLMELSTRGDENATRQLKVLKSLEQTVKVEKPKSISEHLKIVCGDIQKVFVNPNKGKNPNTTFIPQEYRLSQNYPNPFNPTTKISYDIPKNSIVKIIIYDILGREVMKLVNNEFKQPGSYVVEFNGTYLASGVYFYRIEANDFVQSKKMVLVK